MKATLRVIKPEIRILGLDRCSSTVVVGAVVRGGLYLDGVVLLSRSLRDRQLASAIKETVYFPELKAIMTHDPGLGLDQGTVERVTGLPVIQISSRFRTRNNSWASPKSRSKLQIQTSLDHSTLDRLLGLTRVQGQLPEPVRIAHLLGKLHIFGRISQDKG